VTVVHFYIMGEKRYYEVGREAIHSILQQTKFDVVVGCDDPSQLREFRTRRVRFVPVMLSGDAYAGRTLLFKLESLHLAQPLFDSYRFVLCLDPDTVLIRPLTDQNIEAALANRTMGLVEQGLPSHATTTKTDLWENYLLGLRLLQGEDVQVPDSTSFRYYNGGVVLAEVNELRKFSAWARPLAHRIGPGHDFGPVFVADQHYFQVWANHLHPERIIRLPWSWNYCEHWDEGFNPREATILHFSNYCLGPASTTVQRMREARHRTAPVGKLNRIWQWWKNGRGLS
jgi:hypothetical protein